MVVGIYIYNIIYQTYVYRDMQWSPSNPDTVGTQYWWLDYWGVLFSRVIDTTWVWHTTISNDAMWPVTSKLKHMEATSSTERWHLAVLVLFKAFSSSCCSFNQWIYKCFGKVSTIRVSLHGQWYCWDHTKCPLYGIVGCLHFRGWFM